MTLKDWLLKTDVKVYEFAKLIGVDRSYLFNVMKGRYIPSDQLMKRISQVTMQHVNTKEELIGLKFKEK